MLAKFNYKIIQRCRSCGNKELAEIYSIDNIPVAGIYYDDNREQLNIKIPMTLMCCGLCGLLQLKETINDEIYREYNFVGNSSLSYNKHLNYISKKLINDWGIANKRVFEIGASNGVLLEHMAEKGLNNVAGIEPSYRLRTNALTLGVELRQGYFNSDFVQKENLSNEFDCVIIRHVLEHIDSLNDFVNAVKIIIKKNGILALEVPDFDAAVKRHQYSNVFHEHLNYFSIDSLNNLFSQHGFKIFYNEPVDIHGGSIFTIYRLEGSFKEFDKTNAMVDKYRTFFLEGEKYYSLIKEKVVDLISRNMSVHGYGASHRTFVILSNSGLNNENIPFIYDNNSFLQNKKLNGLHSHILPIEYIKRNNPDNIIIFATSYNKEIRKVLQEMDFKGEIISLADIVLKDA